MYCIGIDLGGTNIVAAVVDEKYHILGQGKLKTSLPRPANEIFDDMAQASRIAVQNAGISMDEIEWVGVGSPGTVNQDTGVIEYSNNLEFDNVPARDMLEKRLHKKVYLENDANCAALGEALAGCGNGVKNFVAVTLGTGVGSGVVIDGKIYNGSNFAASEIGHTVIMMDGEPCTCGTNGCWEAYASATALIRQTKEAMGRNPDSIMWQLVNDNNGKVSGRTAFDAMRKGDQAGKEVVDTYIKYVGVGLANIVNIFEPDVICVGGGLSNEGDNLIVPLREYCEKHRTCSIHCKKQSQIVKAELGNNAGIIGAALLGNE